MVKIAKLASYKFTENFACRNETVARKKPRHYLTKKLTATAYRLQLTAYCLLPSDPPIKQMLKRCGKSLSTKQTFSLPCRLYLYHGSRGDTELLYSSAVLKIEIFCCRNKIKNYCSLPCRFQTLSRFSNSVAILETKLHKIT